MSRRTTTLTLDESALEVLGIAIEYASENGAFRDGSDQDKIADQLYDRILAALNRVEGGAR